MVQYVKDELSSTVESRFAMSRWTKNAKSLIKMRQTASKNAALQPKQAYSCLF